MVAPMDRTPPASERVNESTAKTGGDVCQGRRRLFFVVSSILFVIAGATLGVAGIGRTFADDGKVNHDLARYGIQTLQGVLVAAGVGLFLARGALARTSIGGAL